MKQLSAEHSKALELNLSKTMEEAKACAFKRGKRSKNGNNHRRGTQCVGPCGFLSPRRAAARRDLPKMPISSSPPAHRAFGHAGRAGRCRQHGAQHAARQVGGSDPSGPHVFRTSSRRQGCLENGLSRQGLTKRGASAQYSAKQRQSITWCAEAAAQAAEEQTRKELGDVRFARIDTNDAQ
jgi:hypothetical protein